MNNLMYTPQNLQQVSQLPLGMFMQGLGQLDQFKQADQATLADIAAQRQRAGEKHALDLDQGRATLEGMMLGNDKSRMSNQLQKATLPSDIEAKIFKNTTEMDEGRFNMFKRKVEEGVMNGDPRMQAIYERMPAIQEKRREAAAAAEQAAEQERTKRRGQDLSLQGTMYTADKAAERAAATAAARGNRVPRTFEEQVIFYQEQARAAETPEEQQHFIALANQAYQAKQALEIVKAQAGAAGKPDIGALGVETRPEPAPQPLPGANQGGAPKPQATRTLNGKTYIQIDGQWYEQ